MSHPKLTLGVLVLLLFQIPINIRSQSDCNALTDFDFPAHWGQLSINKSLENYFNSLDRRDGWAAILFSEEDEFSNRVTAKGMAIEDKEAIALITHFESGMQQQSNKKFRVVIEERAPHPIHWVVKDADKIQSFLTPSDFNNFFISRPNKSNDIDYCTENLVIRSWECWISFRAFAKTVMLKGATVLLLDEGKIAEHWEWIDFREVLKGWGVVETSGCDELKTAH